MGSGRFCAYPTSSIRIYTTAAQRDDEAVLLKIEDFIPGMAAESGVNYDTHDLLYKPVVVVPFERYPESADPCSIIQDDKIVRLEGALMSAKVFEIYSGLMGNPGDALHRDNPLYWPRKWSLSRVTQYGTSSVRTWTRILSSPGTRRSRIDMF